MESLLSRTRNNKTGKQKMDTLVFATNNAHKLDEVRKITGGLVHIVSLADIDCHDDIP